MSPLISLILICLLMGAAAYGCGLAPLKLNLPHSQLMAVSIFGSGLLVGTALLVVIPEGIDLLHSLNDDSAHVHTIGVSMLIGFLGMYAVDRIPQISSFDTERLIPAIDLASFRVSSPRDDEVAAGGSLSAGSAAGSDDHNTSYVATALGFIVHALADGIALGSSIAAQNPKLQLVVFLAILIHKAPASFGLTAVLLRDVGDPRKVHRVLIAFAAASPVGALLTYLIVQLLSLSESSSVTYWSGTVLLLSGGTFLFVAMHVLNQCSANSAKDLIISGVGMMVPLITFLAPEV